MTLDAHETAATIYPTRRQAAVISHDFLDAALLNAAVNHGQAAKPRRLNISHHQRQKLQMDVLQREVVEFLETLEREKARQRKASSVLSPTSSVWKKIAKRHQKHRQHSEMQRELLQAAVAGKILLIDDLITLVRQQCRTMDLFAAQSRGLYDAVVLQPTDELLYAMYTHELNGIYAETDDVFKSCGMDLKEESTSYQQITLTANGGTASMQFGWKQLFPCRLKRTCDVMRLLAHLLNRQEEREAYDNVKDPDNTIAAKLRVTSHLPGEALIHRFVHRRFMEDDREGSLPRVWCVNAGGKVALSEASDGTGAP